MKNNDMKGIFVKVVPLAILAEGAKAAAPTMEAIIAMNLNIFFER
jgi:hypothetical protein